MLSVGYINKWFHLGISEADWEIFIIPSLTLLYFFIIFPQLRKVFSEQFIKVRSLDKLIAIPIVFAIIKLTVVYLYLYFPVLLHGDIISIGKDQYVGHEDLSTLGEILLVGIVGPFNEEVLFRFLFLFFLPYFLLFHTFVKKPLILKEDKHRTLALPILFLEKIAKWLYYRAFYFKDKKIVIIWTFLGSVLFSLAHGPDIYSFPIYFLPGIIYCYLFLKYGLLASWIAHGFGNMLSPVINSIYYAIFSSYM